MIEKSHFGLTVKERKKSICEPVSPQAAGFLSVMKMAKDEKVREDKGKERLNS